MPFANDIAFAKQYEPLQALIGSPKTFHSSRTERSLGGTDATYMYVTMLSLLYHA